MIKKIHDSKHLFFIFNTYIKTQKTLFNKLWTKSNIFWLEEWITQSLNHFPEKFKFFINNFKFCEEKYSILHLFVLSYSKSIDNLDEKNLKKIRNVIDTIVNNKLLTDINYKDTIGLSPWNYACLLLQKENAFAIKKHNQVTDEDRKFLQETLNFSSQGWMLEEIEVINQIASKNRKDILKYYKVLIEEDVVSSINDDKNLPIEPLSITNSRYEHYSSI